MEDRCGVVAEVSRSVLLSLLMPRSRCVVIAARERRVMS
jgi:hypothetical protein